MTLCSRSDGWLSASQSNTQSYFTLRAAHIVSSALSGQIVTSPLEYFYTFTSQDLTKSQVSVNTHVQNCKL